MSAVVGRVSALLAEEDARGRGLVVRLIGARGRFRRGRTRADERTRVRGGRFGETPNLHSRGRHHDDERAARGVPANAERRADKCTAGGTDPWKLAPKNVSDGPSARLFLAAPSRRP